VHAPEAPREAVERADSSSSGSNSAGGGSGDGTTPEETRNTGNSEETGSPQTQEYTENNQNQGGRERAREGIEARGRGPATPGTARTGRTEGGEGSDRTRREGAARTYDETTRRTRRPNRIMTGYVEGEGRRREPRLALTVRMSEAALDAVVGGLYEWRDGDLRRGRTARRERE
jgi:hypothetical protein